jgi:hypothetical protein
MAKAEVHMLSSKEIVQKIFALFENAEEFPALEILLATCLVGFVLVFFYGMPSWPWPY